ncbi:hypothetical protein Plhal304r1_c040g0117491 [Plasmopara halstedii]
MFTLARAVFWQNSCKPSLIIFELIAHKRAISLNLFTLKDRSYHRKVLLQFLVSIYAFGSTLCRTGNFHFEWR